MDSTLSLAMRDAIFDAIGVIRREIGNSYPYSAGTATINCAGFDRKTLEEIIKYFLKVQCSISINYEKKQVKISGYMHGY